MRTSHASRPKVGHRHRCLAPSRRTTIGAKCSWRCPSRTDTTASSTSWQRPQPASCCAQGADQDAFAGSIISYIRESIQSAQYMVAVATEENGNVYYEIGLAHCQKKPVVLLTADPNSLKFDLRDHRTLVYDPGRPEALLDRLVTMFKGLVAVPSDPRERMRSDSALPARKLRRPMSWGSARHARQSSRPSAFGSRSQSATSRASQPPRCRDGARRLLRCPRACRGRRQRPRPLEKARPVELPSVRVCGQVDAERHHVVIRNLVRRSGFIPNKSQDARYSIDDDARGGLRPNAENVRGKLCRDFETARPVRDRHNFDERRAKRISAMLDWRAVVAAHVAGNPRVEDRSHIVRPRDAPSLSFQNCFQIMSEARHRQHISHLGRTASRRCHRRLGLLLDTTERCGIRRHPFLDIASEE